MTGSEAGGGRLPEGWYPDPERGGAERWWDGVAWTEFRRHVVPDDARRLVERAPLVHRPDDATRALSVIVGSPVWVGALYWAVSMLTVPFLIRMPFAERPFIKLTFLGVMLLVLTVVAWLDARTLRGRGFASVPSPLWALATPIAYLVRRARVDGADRIPLVIHLALLGVSVFGLLLGIALGIQHLAM
ncbi:MAG: hypothetical protein DI534_04370 [Leifsonia xyli]|nr:MAG: hypothetical protein DI534_04370 [Leifsonia xyli]